MSYCRYCGKELRLSWTGHYITKNGAKEKDDRCVNIWCSQSNSWVVMLVLGLLLAGITAAVVGLVVYLSR